MSSVPQTDAICDIKQDSHGSEPTTLTFPISASHKPKTSNPPVESSHPPHQHTTMTSSTSRTKDGASAYESHLQSVRKSQKGLFKDVQFISTEAASDLLQEQRNQEACAKVASNDKSGASRKVLFIDCRSDEERHVSTIPDSITKDEFLQNKDNIFHSNPQNIVCFCTIGMRSGMAAAEIQKKLSANEKQQQQNNSDVQLSVSPNVYNLEGGIIGWARGRHPLVDPATQESTTKVHTYNHKFDLLPPEYEVQHFGAINGAIQGAKSSLQALKLKLSA